MALNATCLNCKKLIRSGRSDKKFCDNACKDAYYNMVKAKEHSEIKKVDIILKRNRRILSRNFNERYPERLIPLATLHKSGFDFDYHTHMIITKAKKNQFIFCYNFGYREEKPGEYRIIKSF